MPHTAPPTSRPSLGKADPLPSPVIWAFNIFLRGACIKTSSISCTQKPGYQAALDKLELTEPSLLPTPPPREVGGGLKSQVIGPRSLCEHPARTDSSWCGILTAPPHHPQPTASACGSFIHTLAPLPFPNSWSLQDRKSLGLPPSSGHTLVTALSTLHISARSISFCM